jgi:hypothetical protein
MMSAVPEPAGQSSPGWPPEQAAAAVGLVTAPAAVADAAAAVVVICQDVPDYAALGTAELPSAIAALDLVLSPGVDAWLHQICGAARAVAQAFTAGPAVLIPMGVHAVELGGAVIGLRAALMDLDKAVAAADAAGLI